MTRAQALCTTNERRPPDHPVAARFVKPFGDARFRHSRREARGRKFDMYSLKIRIRLGTKRDESGNFNATRLVFRQKKW
jgi:hypothetical protein